MKPFSWKMSAMAVLLLSLLVLPACGTSTPEPEPYVPGIPGTPNPGVEPTRFGPAGVDMSKDPAIPYGGMTFAWSNAGFDYSDLNPPHWIVNAYEGYLEFTWTGRYFFKHRLRGTRWTDGGNYSWYDVYVNGQLHAWALHAPDEFEANTIPDYYFTEGVNTVRFVLMESSVYGFRTFLCSDHVWLDTGY